MNEIRNCARICSRSNGSDCRVHLSRWAKRSSFKLCMAAVIVVTAGLIAGCGKDGSKAVSGDGKSGSASEKGADKAEAKGGKEEKEAKLEKGHVKLSDAEVQEAGIKAEEMKTQSLPEQLVLTATISANQDRMARISPRVPAKMTAVKANLGDKVAAGQVLAILDSMEVGEAQSAWRQALSQESLALSEFERAESLKRDQIIADKDYLRSRSEYEKAKTQTHAAEDKLRLLGITPTRGAARSGATFALTAPFAGTVVEKKAVVGELAQPDKSAFTVADLSTVWIDATLFEKDLSRVKIGAAATVGVSAYPGETFKGRVTHIGNMLDKDTRALLVRVVLQNPGGRLKPEMFGTAMIETTATAPSMQLPEAAVLLLNGEPTVFIDADGDYEARHVEVGSRRDGMVTIKNGIKPGEWVVGKGAFAIKSKLLKSQIGDAD